MGYPVYEEPLPQPTSLNLSYFSVHGVAFSDAPLMPERLGTLTPAPASTGIEGNCLFHRTLQYHKLSIHALGIVTDFSEVSSLYSIGTILRLRGTVPKPQKTTDLILGN